MIVEMFVAARRKKPRSKYTTQTAYAPVVACESVKQAKEIAARYFPNHKLTWSDPTSKVITSDDLLIDGVEYFAVIEVTAKVHAKDVAIALPRSFKDD